MAVLQTRTSTTVATRFARLAKRNGRSVAGELRLLVERALRDAETDAPGKDGRK